MAQTEITMHGTRCSSCGSTRHATCPPCDAQTPLRNNYFFGKLMDVPDFDVEQLYLVDKFRRHHSRLHGVGVICGLEVQRHPTPSCRTRYATVAPGSALDCCGNEILVVNTETVDLLGFKSMQTLLQNPDDRDHVLQLCVRYRECPTEEVPVLYDDCGCEDNRCAPNRILETYAFDVLVDPPLPAPWIPGAPSLAWESTIALSGARALVVHQTSLRLYVAADQSPTGGVIQQYQLATLAPLAPRVFPTAIRGMALSQDGRRLFVVVAGAAAADACQLHTLDTTTAASFSSGATSPVDIPTSAGASAVSILLLPDGSVATLAVDSGLANTAVQVWDTTAAPVAAAGRAAAVTTALLGPSLGSDQRMYAAASSAAIFSFDTAAAGLDPKSTAVGAANVVGFAVATSTGPDTFVWIESTSKKLSECQRDGSNLRSVVLADTPVALILRNGAGTAFVLTEGATQAAVQSVDLYALATAAGAVIGVPIDIGTDGKALALDGRLFASYADGVAVLDIQSLDCGASLQPHACPGCETADCIVLATMVGYRPGYTFDDITVPPSDPVADGTAHVTRLDNLLGRLVVPSTTDLAAAVNCLLKRPGGTGSPGMPGPPGLAGVNGKDGVNGTNGKDGKDGVDATLDWDLPHICDFNWLHGGTAKFAQVTKQGLIVAFDTPVLGSDLNGFSIEVQAQRPDPALGSLIACWCDLNLIDSITPGSLKTQCDTSTTFVPGLDANGMATAVRIIPRALARLMSNDVTQVPLRVSINGDFVRGMHHKSQQLRALDADHIPKLDPPSPPGAPQPGITPDWMKPGDGRYTGDGIEGGTFMSWFTVVKG